MVQPPQNGEDIFGHSYGFSSLLPEPMAMATSGWTLVGLLPKPARTWVYRRPGGSITKIGETRCSRGERWAMDAMETRVEMGHMRKTPADWKTVFSEIFLRICVNGQYMLYSHWLNTSYICEWYCVNYDKFQSERLRLISGSNYEYIASQNMLASCYIVL